MLEVKGNLTADDVTLLANRINWLQNNPFRWNMRDGYDAYFAAKLASSVKPAAANHRLIDDGERSIIPTKAKSVDVGVSDSAPGAVADSDPRKPAKLTGAVRGASHQAPQAVLEQGRDLSGPIFISADDPAPSDKADDRYSRNSTPETGTTRGPSKGHDTIQHRVPEYPDKPKTIFTTFPHEKAVAFLKSNWKRDPIEIQISLGRALIDDPSEFAASLAYSDQARIDLLNALAKLGLKIDG